MILPNDFKRQWAAIGKVVHETVERVGASGWYILGKEVEAFENSVANLFGLQHAVGVANGMDAIEISLRVLGLKPGEKVLTTPLSAFATTLAILRCGGVPVFCDVDALGAIDLEGCRTLLREDQSIRFLLPVHLYGLPIDLRELQRLKDDHNLLVVEDCAQAIGASFDGVAVGSVGDLTATSFYPTKNLGALGDGGMLLTNDRARAEEARTLRNYGQSSLYFHSELGLNSRLDEIQAAILRDAFLPSLEKWTERRRAIARSYQQLIKHELVELLSPPPEANSVWHLFPVLVRDSRRESLQKHLRSLDILTGIHYPRLINEQEALLRSGFNIEETTNLAHAKKFADAELSLPIHPFLEDDEVAAIAAGCNSWNP